LAILERFLPGRRFILRLKRASFLREKAGTFDTPIRTVITVNHMTAR